MRTTASIAVMAILVLSAPAVAADVAKVAVIDLQAAMEKSKAGRQAYEEFETSRGKMKASLEEKEAEIEKRKEDLDRKRMSGVMDPAEADKENQRIKDMLIDLKALQEKYVQQSKQQERRLVLRVLNDIHDLVQNMGREGGYLLILDKKAGILYSPSTIDITDEVIRRYDETYRKKPEAG
ncbi:OmpH family outer membrane protein [Thermodesulfobacteriota bacterium]